MGIGDEGVAALGHLTALVAELRFLPPKTPVARSIPLFLIGRESGFTAMPPKLDLTNCGDLIPTNCILRVMGH